jgi:hypothetical protein
VAPIICVLAPAMAFVLDKTSAMWLGGYKFGFEMLAINGLITFSGLMLISSKSNQAEIDAREI